MSDIPIVYEYFVRESKTWFCHRKPASRQFLMNMVKDYQPKDGHTLEIVRRPCGVDTAEWETIWKKKGNERST